jgi:hypothetical protein
MMLVIEGRVMMKNGVFPGSSMIKAILTGAVACAGTMAVVIPGQAAGVRLSTLEGFLPSAEATTQYVDAGSAMPPDVLSGTDLAGFEALTGLDIPQVQDVLGRQWASVVRTYWSYPVPGLGEIPSNISSTFLPGLLHAGLGDPYGLVSLLASIVPNLVPELSALPIPTLFNYLNHMETGLVAHPGAAMRHGLKTIRGIYGAVGRPGLSYLPLAGYGLNLLTDWVPGVPPIYQVQIDYFKVGTARPVPHVAAPMREMAGGFLRGVFGPVRGLVQQVRHEGASAVASQAIGASCTLRYTQDVALVSGSNWPPAQEVGFECAGVAHRNLVVNVGSEFPLAQEDWISVWYDPFTGDWNHYTSPSGLLMSVLMGALPERIPLESLVVTISDVKDRDQLLALGRAIDYRGLCWAVHADGSGCPTR